jgi:hypothetical protein
MAWFRQQNEEPTLGDAGRGDEGAGRGGVAALRQETHGRATMLLVAGGSICSWMWRRESRSAREI